MILDAILSNGCHVSGVMYQDKKMLLAVDIGNTNISCGIFTGSRLVKRFSLPTKAKSNYQIKLKPYLSRNIDEAIICSVVPDATKEIVRAIKSLTGQNPRVLGKNIKVPIKNLYAKPRQVGQDRLVNAYAAARLYGYPAVVVDFGTAVTFDIVSHKKEYLGGLILPGLNISLDALYARTALLPHVKLARPKGLIGKDTKSSILSGMVYGFAALTDDLIGRMREKIGKNTKAIGTGGNISLIGPYCRKIQIIDQDLTLKGLQLLRGDVSL